MDPIVVFYTLPGATEADVRYANGYLREELRQEDDAILAVWGVGQKELRNANVSECVMHMCCGLPALFLLILACKELVFRRQNGCSMVLFDRSVCDVQPLMKSCSKTNGPSEKHEEIIQIERAFVIFSVVLFCSSLYFFRAEVMQMGRKKTRINLME